MRITPEHTRMLMGALGAASSVVASHVQLEQGRNSLRAVEVQLLHQRNFFEAKAGLMRDLIGALIEKRIAAVERGFHATLQLYADQNREYMAEKRHFADRQITVTDPSERANLSARLKDVDLELKRICRDAADLYREMNRVILLIGGTMPIMSLDDQKALMFSPTN